MFPLGDDNTGRRIVPVVTYALIVINVLFFLVELSGGDAFVQNWSIIPRELMADPADELITLFTAMFMHGSWMHLLGNMLYLWIFGDNVEDRLGHAKFLIFYLLCGLVATFAQVLVNPGTNVPNLGASGAIAGVLGAYLVMFPGPEITVYGFRGQSAPPNKNEPLIPEPARPATVRKQVVSAELAVTKSVLPANPAELTDVTYTLILRNNGPSDTTNVVLTDTLPTGLTFLSATADRGIYNLTNGAWNVGSLANDETVTLNITALVNANTRGQTIVNTTNGLRSDLYDSQSANNQASASFRVLPTRLIGLVSRLGATPPQPIASANLVFTDSLNHVYTTTTSASGWYTFTETIDRPIAAGNASIRASKPGYNPLTLPRTIVANQDNQLDFPLTTSDLAVTKANRLTTVIPK